MFDEEAVDAGAELASCLVNSEAYFPCKSKDFESACVTAAML